MGCGHGDEVVGGGQVAVFDAKSNEPPTRGPLSQTPLSVILAKNVNLEQSRMVLAHTSDGTQTTVVAQDPRNAEFGNIRLVFTDNPVQLRQWIIDDNSGSLTTIILGEMNAVRRIPDVKFNIQSEMRKWKP